MAPRSPSAPLRSLLLIIQGVGFRDEVESCHLEAVATWRSTGDPRNPWDHSMDHSMDQHQRSASERLGILYRNCGFILSTWEILRVYFCIRSGWLWVVSHRMVLGLTPTTGNPEYLEACHIKLDAVWMISLKCPANIIIFTIITHIAG